MKTKPDDKTWTLNSPNYLGDARTSLIECTPFQYPDGRLSASYRMEAKDQGIILRHSQARDVMGSYRKSNYA